MQTPKFHEPGTTPVVREPGVRARSVAFEGVSVGQATDADLLEDVSFEIGGGERVAFVGALGGRTSAIGALLAGSCDPSAGRVLIDGRPIREYAAAWLRRQVLVVSGGAPSIAYSGLPAVPSRDGARRGGQRLLVGTDRRQWCDPSIVLVDEPARGLGAESEAEIMERLDRIAPDRTMLVVTRSIALALAADRVIVFRRGRVVESGSPTELLARDSSFVDLVTNHASWESGSHVPRMEANRG